ncbi:hypothetical protein [Dietzia sp. 179-F 9C3 NHS]|uniref:hypothetical protein n=1 Tax=Dietzia sp. 179-F 9C3 NHS TaxID=3374295 RepID=UPI0038799756
MSDTATTRRDPLDLAIATFLDLNDGGGCRETNPEYYRAGFELIAATHMQNFDADHRRDLLGGLIAAHACWTQPGLDGTPLDTHTPAVEDEDDVRPRVTFEVEMTRCLSLDLTLPDGVSLADCSSKRLYRWPEALLKTITDAVIDELKCTDPTDLADNITEVSFATDALESTATW